MPAACRDCSERLTSRSASSTPALNTYGLAFAMCGSNQHRAHNREGAALGVGGHGTQRLGRRLHAFPGPVCDRHDERLGRVQYELAHALGHPAQGGRGQILFTAEDAFARNRPVNALGGSAPLLLTLGGVLCVSGLRPHDRLAIAAGNHEQALTTGRGPEIAGLNHPPLNDIAQALQFSHENCPRLAAAFWIGYQELFANRYNFACLGNPATQLDDAPGRLAALRHKRSPLQDLLHVLQADHPGALHACPLEADPRQITNLPLARLATGSLAVVGAVRRHVEPTHGSATAFGIWIALKNISGEVLCMRVVDGVHADRGRAVVFGDSYRTPKAHFQTCTSTATSAEEVHDDLVILLVEAEAVLGFEVEGVFLLVFGHGVTFNRSIICLIPLA
ncbi:hypothetical protein PLUA15_540045 [Pseudomonas lundensis]|uniref:Uncharacterized protein n=1 Tax=Pseudomonas lundensis TaxID=86185 RepID=A0AAX2HEX6_9PSED|nr:hypothetical protein PLUA15_540045 [Pseudomonas lundensis]